ncbi:MAG: hypothetical protein WAV45_13170 [Propionibacteriaceae bacterium]|nr:hypothetical protein [Micropruina sp.]
MTEQDAELLSLVRSLTDRVQALETEIKGLRILTKDVPEETMVAIAAAVAAYLGLRAKKRQVAFSKTASWGVTTRRIQHSHQPLHLR